MNYLLSITFDLWTDMEDTVNLCISEDLDLLKTMKEEIVTASNQSMDDIKMVFDQFHLPMNTKRLEDKFEDKAFDRFWTNRFSVNIDEFTLVGLTDKGYHYYTIYKENLK